MEKSVFFEHIRNRYGFIKRCRGPYLYTSKEVRLIDMYQEGGRALLGWREGKSMQVLKNTLERGLWGNYPGLGERRLEKALGALFTHCGAPEFTKFSFLFTSSESSSYEGYPLLYPWNGFSPGEGIEKSDVVYLVPPFPIPSLVIAASSSASFLPPSQPLSLFIMEALSRAVYDLIDSFSVRKNDLWAQYDDLLSPFFTRKGSALYPAVLEKDYDAFVLHCLDCGLVINPSPAYPSFVPYGITTSALKMLSKKEFKPGE
ncbi:MAG TPA: hypothetical protein PLU33_03055 [Treponemataceae bacterium]|jgi:hypothetical protein|nr:hypothetical protein [Treponemataceae bacterium]HOS30226.1 hypothetical protein [Treponemataceae bacterium]HQL04087.1 hypothetical protein [Treponemataceae bacterium]